MLIRTLPLLCTVVKCSFSKAYGLNCTNFRNFTANSILFSNSWGSKAKRKHRNIKLQVYFDAMADPKIEQILAPLRARVKEQVRCFFF